MADQEIPKDEYEHKTDFEEEHKRLLAAGFQLFHTTDAGQVAYHEYSRHPGGEHILVIADMEGKAQVFRRDLGGAAPDVRSYLVHAVVDVDVSDPLRRHGSYDAGDAATYFSLLFNRLEPGDKLVDIRVYLLDPANTNGEV